MIPDSGDSSTQDDHILQDVNGTSDAMLRQNSDRMPRNPFAKTLASLSTEMQPGPITLENDRRKSDAESKVARPLYDVEDFKKLLLTGERSASTNSVLSAPPASFQIQPSVGDTNSNTDTSSISRQSIFEPAAGPLYESPKTSREGSPLSDERQVLIEHPSSAISRPKPPTPRHRHGKLVKANGPQTVSFEDPTLSFKTNTAASSGTLHSTSPKLPSSNNKPLPSIPLRRDSDNVRNTINSNDNGNRLRSNSGSADIQRSPSLQKRNPPPPPVSRRHSLRPKPLAASDWSATISEEGPAESQRRSSSPSSTNSKFPPPPPPPRRSGRTRGSSFSSVSTSASIEPVSQHNAEEHLMSR